MTLLTRNLEAVHNRIAAAAARSGRGAADVLLVAVTKQRPMADVEALFALGQRAFGENRVQEVRERVPTGPPGAEWHFIGHLQSNKAKYLPGLVSWVHSVDSVELARALDRAYGRHPNAAPVRVLLQFNISGEPQKYGADFDSAVGLAREALALPHIRVEGLMCMAPYSDDAEVSRPVFRGLRALRDRLREQTGAPLPHLSMGMSNDFEVGIEEGATIVRVGSALFEE